MVKVITYGTYDLLHYGHIKLLEHAKSLGDYLIVGVTADDFDKTRGKINVQQSLMERIEAVRATGLADKIIVEEYEGQKIDDIRRYDVDIFTVGSDWVGKFDYLNEYCKVVYLPRTEGVSSTEIRAHTNLLKLGIVGENAMAQKYLSESRYVNSVQISAVYSKDETTQRKFKDSAVKICDTFEELLEECNAVYIDSVPQKHERQIRTALKSGKHVLCESPITLDPTTTKELFDLARSRNLVLMEAIKTAFTTAYNRLLLLIKGGRIGKVVSVDSVCTSLMEKNPLHEQREQLWSGFEAWAPTALLPIYQILGTEKCSESFVASFYNEEKHFDRYTQVNIVYPDAVAMARVGMGIKSEGQLIVSGTRGYIYVPAPWWKTDYFEIRYEDQTNNRRYFYQLDGEGIRCGLVSFARAVREMKHMGYIDEDVTIKIADVFKKYENREQLIEIN